MMNLLNYLRRRSNTATVAKERLQIIISHERGQRSMPDYLPKLQEEIINVIAKYVPINKDQVSVHLEKMGSNAVLELNITMPETVIEAEQA